MRMYLSALGWVPEAPVGNRLRWSYPTDTEDGAGAYLGLPDVLYVQRAPLDEDIPKDHTGTGPAGLVPYGWWEYVGNVYPSGLFPLVYELPHPVQAVQFVYRGPTARIRAWDVAADRVVGDRVASDGDLIVFESSSIDGVEVQAFFSALLEDVRILDLFDDHGLDFTTIAKLSVVPTVGADRDDVARRYDQPMTLSGAEWAELVALAGEAQASTPATAPTEEPTPWQEFQAALGLRWEFAVEWAFGFFDGPRSEVCSLDSVDLDGLLEDSKGKIWAYRVVEEAGRVPPSNIVACPPWDVAPLAVPATPVFQDPRVRLTTEGVFEATYGITWQGFDARAIGVEIEERTSASPSVPGSAVTVDFFENRSHRPIDPPLGGQLARTNEVVFHDVRVAARARAVDGWDRTSGWSVPTPDTAVALDHHPAPPPLFSAWREGSNATIHRAVHDPDLGAWQPSIPDWASDVVVQAAGGSVVVYRRTGMPQTASVTVSDPVLVSGRTYRTQVVGYPAGALGVFAGGYLVAGSMKARIASVAAGAVSFEAPDQSGGGASLFGAGPATLQQDPTDLSLWTPVATFPAVGLPADLTFADPLPPPAGGGETISYCVRVSFLGRTGPASNVVQALWLPVVPPVPPPFAVSLLGVDYYHRSLVRVDLTTPVSGGRFQVWWADGWAADWPSGTSFKDHATPGEYENQSPQGGITLYDVLSLPTPKAVDRRVTIGLQAQNPAGGQSDFQTVPVVLHPPGP